METYYLYINIDDLNRFLVENLIFPHHEEYLGRRTLSLTYDNILLLSKKKYSREIIADYCNDGYTSAIVLELDIVLDKANIMYKDDEILLINDVISFSNVKSIYNVFEELPGFIFNDIYMFESLLKDNFFDFGEDTLNIQEIEDKICPNKAEELKETIKYWSKIQGFYCARFGLLLEEKVEKKKLILKRNIDSDSFKYVCDLAYDDFIVMHYETKKKKQKQISFFDNETMTTYLNDNFEKIIKKVLTQDLEGNNEYNFHEKLYSILLDYKSGDLIEILSNYECFDKQLKNIKCLETRQMADIAFLKKYFNENKDDRLTMTLFILSRIIDMDVDRAQAYINNFFIDKSEYEKELLAMYGLAKGMKGISITIKQKPDTLLFAFNRTKKFFNHYVDVVKDYKDNYYKQRLYTPECLLKDGFDLKLFDEEHELDYINEKLRELIARQYGFEQKQINQKIIKNLKPGRLHKEFLKYKGENK